MTSTVQLEIRDQIAWVALNRPDQLNAYNVDMRDDLFDVFSFIDREPALRCVVIHGAGRSFCAGADLSEFGSAPSPVIARHVRFARDLWGLLLGLDVPTVAALHGHVIGSGLELAMLCDFRVAEVGTTFRMPEVRWGLIPAAGGTQTLPRIVGQSAALGLLLTGRTFDVEEAARLGLLSQVVERGQRLEVASDYARRLANLDPLVVRHIRREVLAGAELPAPIVSNELSAPRSPR